MQKPKNKIILATDVGIPTYDWQLLDACHSNYQWLSVTYQMIVALQLGC